MGKIFYNKKLTYLVLALALVLLILSCVLLTMLTQYTALSNKAAELGKMIDEAKSDKEAAEKLLEYMKSDEYVIKWATDNGKLTQDQINWVESNK